MKKRINFQPKIKKAAFKAAAKKRPSPNTEPNNTTIVNNNKIKKDYNTELVLFKRDKPEQYKIVCALAKGLNQKKTFSTIFAEIGVNYNRGYSIYNRHLKYVSEMRQSITETQENCSSLLQAKNILVEGSPDMAQFILDLVRNNDAPMRERRQAAKDGLQLAGLDEATAPPPDYDRVMKNFILNIFYGKPIDSELTKTIDIEPK